MTAVLPVARAAPLEGAARAWRRHLAVLLLGTGSLLILLRHDVTDLVRIWAESSTYNHCFFILPIAAWLVWQRRPELAQLTPVAWAPGLALFAAGAAAWMLGWAGSLALARHLGLVVMLQGLAVTSLGKAVSRGLAFPLFYLFFLIPAGEEIVPLMQTVTAHMCMALLALAGIPAHLEGIFISTPTGLFKVAEACSGVKFLVAMIAYGALVANVCFRSWTRRILFMAAAVVIPVLANGVRAWSIILVASHKGADAAIVYDHVLYGWIFFAIVIALLMAAGWRFFDRRVSDPWFVPASIQPRPLTATRAGLYGAAGACLSIALSVQLLAASADARAERGLAAHLALPTPSGWDKVEPGRKRSWAPHFAGADRIAMASYRDGRGHEVDLAVILFAGQTEGREIVGFGQGAVGPDGDWSWIAQGPAPLGGRLDRIASFGTVREVATFYRIGGIVTGSGARVKLETMKARLLGGPGRAVAVLVSAEAPAEGVSPRPAIDAFLADLGPVERLADRATGGAR